MNITAKTPPSVSAIVPARNEQATIAQCIESLAQQPEIAEILVVNDLSTDSTSDIVQELLQTYPQLRLLQTTTLPPGWVGKNHAVYHGSREAKGDWLLFTDADVVHEKNSVARALQIAASGTGTPACALGVSSSHPQLISFSPEQLTESWYEKSLIPVVYCRLSKKFSFTDVNDPNNPAAAANGQFLMISREAYDAVGGHAAIANEVLEDVALSQKVKQAGYRIWFGSGEGIVRVRMYRTFAAMWEGWKKNLYRLIGAHPKPLLEETFHAVAPILIAIFSTAAVWHSRYRRELRRNQYPAKLVCYGIPGKLLYAGVLWASYRAHQKGSLAWKGREYPVGTPHASNDVPKG